jgi:hypothetical protein
MRRIGRSLVVAGMVAAATIAVPALPAFADPCGSSSWKSGNVQNVGYRNCGGGTIFLKGYIDSSYGWCLGIPGNGGSGVLQTKNIGGGGLHPWGTVWC